MESYRRHILPNLVRYYRGIYARRQIDPNSAFGDLVFAQQNLATNVQAYLNLLQSLWTSVASVADFLQTDDLYQMGTRHELPALPDFRLLRLSPWMQGHDRIAASGANGEPEPLCAVYHRRCLPGVARAIRENRFRMRGLLKELGAESVSVDPGAVANVNTPIEWAEFEAKLP